MHKGNDDMPVGCEDTACAGGRTDRREFLQSAGCFGIAVALLGLSSSDAAALTVALIEGTPVGDERQYPIPTADCVNVDRKAQVIIARFSGHVYAFALACPHENNAVKWLPRDGRFQCTKHDSQYHPDGAHTAGRATRNMDRYAIRREGDVALVNMHKWFQSDKDPEGWVGATIVV
jgi:nitrite reductase/ring-hydroxylating ferredoxin subunit